MRQQTLFADMPANVPRPTKRDELMAVAVDQPIASLMAAGSVWLMVSPVKLSPQYEVAILAKRPSPIQLRDVCRKHCDALLSIGIRRFDDLPMNAFVGVGSIVSRKQVPYRHHDRPFWEAIANQLDFVDMRPGDYAYRLSLEAIRPVEYRTDSRTFKITRATLA